MGLMQDRRLGIRHGNEVEERRSDGGPLKVTGQSSHNRGLYGGGGLGEGAYLT